MSERLARGHACVILGAGGHSRVLIDLFESCGIGRPFGLLDADASRWGHDWDGVPILGGEDLLPSLRAKGVVSFLVGVGSIGDASIRRRLFAQACAAGLEPAAVVHPTAVVSKAATLGACQVLPAAVINAGARIGDNVIINTGAIVEHDCVVHDHAHIATRAALASTVHVGVGAHVGAGAVIRQCITIGDEAIVGAGAAVVADVALRTTVVGVPARPLTRVPQ